MTNKNRVIDERYEIKAIIGQGGMADVYLAEDLILHREVAVKILRENLAEDPIYVKRFKREASAAATLANKNIVEIYDVGQENQRYYIVMEYVSGQTLKELIYKRGALHMAEAIDIMKQVTSGVVAAHQCGIIHRDLKPQNILVTDSGIAKIADFGIASIESVTNVTKADTIMGSLHYLAPEIARGEKATPQSDIYALGIMFYELLVGQVPFNGESAVNIALKHMREDIPSVRDINPTIYQSVENIIIKATAKNLENRYQDASEMLEDLSTALSRDHDPKLVFALDQEADKTIIADNTEFYKTANLANEETKTVQISGKEEIEVKNKKDNKKKDKKKKSKKIATIMAIVGVVVLCAVLYIVVANPFAPKEVMVNMPDVVGKTLDEARTMIEEQKLVVDDNITYTASDEYEKDQVISSDPLSGTEIAENSEVKLTVSTGKNIVIESYIGKYLSEVQPQLEELGFTVMVTEEESDQPVGMILGQSIEEGKIIDPNAPSKMMTFRISSGYSATVNNYIGMDIQAAKQSLESNGFVVELKVLDSPTNAIEIQTMKINVVIEQSITPYTEVTERNTKITLSYYDHRPEIPKEPEDNSDDESNDSNNSGSNNENSGSDSNTSNDENSNGTQNNNQSGQS